MRREQRVYCRILRHLQSHRGTHFILDAATTTGPASKTALQDTTEGPPHGRAPFNILPCDDNHAQSSSTFLVHSITSVHQHSERFCRTMLFIISKPELAPRPTRLYHFWTSSRSESQGRKFSNILRKMAQDWSVAALRALLLLIKSRMSSKRSVYTRMLH